MQDEVKTTLETLRNAGIRVWMLTGDKAETAVCIGRSCRLIDRSRSVFSLTVRNKRCGTVCLSVCLSVCPLTLTHFSDLGLLVTNGV